MPKVYQKIKNRCISKGGSTKSCKTYAAKVYNTIRKKSPSLPKLSNKKGAK